MPATPLSLGSGALQRPIVRAENLRRVFGSTAVIRRADFTIHAGEVVRLFGPNGSGKTVLLNLMSGYLRPTHGRVYLSGKVVTGLPAWRLTRAGVRRAFQVPHIVAALTVAENLLLAGDAAELWRLLRGGGSTGQRYADAISHLQTWAPELQPDDDCGSLSYGQQRMVELLRCFTYPGTVYFLDEPFSGLGSVFRERVQQLIAAARGGAAIVYAEHDPEELTLLTTRTLTLADGIISEGPPG